MPNLKDHINEVLPGLYIADAKAVSNHAWLKSLGITHIVNCAKELKNQFPTDFHYLTLGLEDKSYSEDLFRVLEPAYRYVNDVMNAKKFRPNVVVHCYAGMSRSASVVIYYLMRKNGWSYAKALSYLKSKRPIVKPNPWYAKQLQDIEKMLASL